MKTIIILLPILLLFSCTILNRWAIESYQQDLDKQQPKKTVYIEKIGLHDEARKEGEQWEPSYKQKWKDKNGNDRESKYWNVKYYNRCKQIIENSKYTKITDAEKLLRIRGGEILQAKIPGIYFDRISFDKLTKGLIDDYVINKQRSLKDLKISVEKHLTPFFKGMTAIRITTPKVQAYIKSRLEQSAANATINRQLTALKRMLNLGAKQTPPKVDRVPHVPKLKLNNARKEFFEHHKFLALRNELPDYLKGFVTFDYKTGWRISIICNLTWKQVDRKNWTVRLEPGTTKNRQDRTGYLDDELEQIFKDQWKAREQLEKPIPHVFINKYGNGKISDIRRVGDKACTDAEIGKCYFHDFRRTAVRNMVRSGIP